MSSGANGWMQTESVQVLDRPPNVLWSHSVSYIIFV